jgi:carbon-monoxide dehydrogenase large subunit
MDMPMDRINRVLHGSTAYVSDGYGSYHSRSIVMGGSAVLDAAAKLKTAMRAEAARRLNCGADEVVLADGRASAPGGKSISWAELAPEPLSAEGSFVNHKHTWAYGAHAAHVSVDPRTGAVALLDYVAVENCGRMINPLTLKGQLVGAVVQGLGGAFMEHLAYDDNGQLLTGSLADYLVPTASDFPQIRGYVMESHPSPVNPLGAKGAGEGGIISVGGVIANAVADALSTLGVEPRDLPLSPNAVWQLVQEARKAPDPSP